MVGVCVKCGHSFNFFEESVRCAEDSYGDIKNIIIEKGFKRFFANENFCTERVCMKCIDSYFGFCPRCKSVFCADHLIRHYCPIDNKYKQKNNMKKIKKFLRGYKK